MSRVEEYVAARVKLYNSLFDIDGEADQTKYEAQSDSLWAAMKPAEHREAEKGYHISILAEERKRAK